MKILFLIVVILFTGCESHSDDVLVIEKTNSYHHDWCIRTNMAKTKGMTLAQAIGLHYDPCPLCMK